jgi:putative Holliday junction resolvase
MLCKKFACIDVGLKRIGVATSLLSNIVTPHKAILRKNRNQASKEIDQFLQAWDIDVLVVGFPSASDDMQKRIKHFITLLSFDKKIVLQEENLSSVEAKDLMKGDIKYKRDGRIDSICAKIILERFLTNKG